ncbi:hypothetical protein GCM10010305_20530 [Streptomyces termitum]|uniref:Uncharacterized protein n=1 Tax=Streptomyces termitum TaxID=67368 RepID=A0A918SZV8_9ACTN|nr:hypothetical protein GCM10010305_20530 [Streptomyces termitum]
MECSVRIASSRNRPARDVPRGEWSADARLRISADASVPVQLNGSLRQIPEEKKGRDGANLQRGGSSPLSSRTGFPSSDFTPRVRVRRDRAVQLGNPWFSKRMADRRQPNRKNGRPFSTDSLNRLHHLICSP